MRNLNIDSLKFYLFIGVFLFHAGLFCPIGWGNYLFVNHFLF